jgi:hypothetical protein
MAQPHQNLPAKQGLPWDIPSALHKGRRVMFAAWQNPLEKVVKRRQEQTD